MSANKDNKPEANREEMKRVLSEVFVQECEKEIRKALIGDETKSFNELLSKTKQIEDCLKTHKNYSSSKLPRHRRGG